MCQNTVLIFCSDDRSSSSVIRNTLASEVGYTIHLDKRLLAIMPNVRDLEAYMLMNDQQSPVWTNY